MSFSSASSTSSLAVMVTTRNREDDLRRTIEVLKRLDPQPDEVLVTADGCTDGTVDLVRQMIPAARLIVNSKGRGSVVSRDQMLRAAKTDLILSLDDDSYPEQTNCVNILRALFESNPDLAVAHFPQRSDEYPKSLKQVDFGKAKLSASFPNSGACYRKSDYLLSEGFPAMFFHAYEEPDYSLQLIAANKVIMFTPSITVRHHYSPVERNELRTHQRHARNELWSALMRCPFPLVLAIVPYRVFSQARYAASRGLSWIVREPVWWVQMLKGIRLALSKRKPVSTRSYLKWLSLLRKPLENEFR